jgi:DNA mismatch endonuclease (patch repair protein)
VDFLDRPSRSRLMSRIPQKNTKPELVVRSAVHRLGFRFRLHKRNLPGSPDLVFASRKAIVFVHGCFWHRHAGCGRSCIPKTRPGYWKAKLDRNVRRDRAAVRKLKKLGWRVLVVWECNTKNVRELEQKLTRFLDPDRAALRR